MAARGRCVRGLALGVRLAPPLFDLPAFLLHLGHSHGRSTFGGPTYIGGGGLGAVALMRGHGRGQKIVMYVAVVILVILVQVIQSIGTAWSVKSDRRINPTETKRRT